jgi:NADH-quinone oxidoreductase subunit J
MEALFFLLFATMATVAALGVVLAKNPVYSALSLIACFVQVAALFVLLRSPFLAVVQIFVYVGTTIVLFILVIVMLDLRRAILDRFIPGNPFWALFVAVSLGSIIVAALLASDRLAELSSSLQSAPLTLAGTTRELGIALFTQFLLPFEVISVILLVAFIGAILLAKKENQ